MREDPSIESGQPVLAAAPAARPPQERRDVEGAAQRRGGWEEQ
jgi:hypothetical protein